MSGSTVARRVRATGRVQGVFFRAWTKEQADALGVGGWVRNCPDGSVEAHLEGDKHAVQRMTDLLHRGPSSAQVAQLAVEDAEAEGAGGFDVRH
jgi:acylphosphatase